MRSGSLSHTASSSQLDREGEVLKDADAFAGFLVDRIEPARAFYSGALGLDITEIPLGSGAD